MSAQPPSPVFAADVAAPAASLSSRSVLPAPLPGFHGTERNDNNLSTTPDASSVPCCTEPVPMFGASIWRHTAGKLSRYTNEVLIRPLNPAAFNLSTIPWVVILLSNFPLMEFIITFHQ